MPPPARGCPTIGRAGVFGIFRLSAVYRQGLKHRFHLIVYILSGEAELFVEDFVWSREAEALETEHLAVAAYESLKVHRKAGCEAEDPGTVRKNALLIFLALAAEETF